VNAQSFKFCALSGPNAQSLVTITILIYLLIDGFILFDEFGVII
jgi:hypothetical protein